MTTNYPDALLLIDNEWRPGRGGATIAVHNPADGAVIGSVACAAIADLDDALQSSARGFECWRSMPAIERARVMRFAATLLRSRCDRIAEIVTLEQGKPLAEARLEVMATADIVEWTADEGQRIYGRVVPPRAPNVQQMVFKEPVGPVAAFTPWNFPVAQVARKLCPALASGCSVIVKAAEETPASAVELVRAFVDAGLPSGVLSLVFGDPKQISDYLIPHPLIRKVTFTGSTAIGKQLAALAGTHMKRTTMELGGHAPVIVAADADIEHAAKVLAAAKFRNSGQICLSPSRFLVDVSVQEEFVARFVALSKAIHVGSGMDAATQMGPLANHRRLLAMQELTEDALAHGATLLAGGSRIGSAGNFFSPTVLLAPPLSSRILNDEPFGPIVAVRSVRNLDEAIAEANLLPYGLASYAFTRSIASVHQLTNQLQAGSLWINQAAAAWPELPFGGVKDSGYGSEGGIEGIDAYLNTKTVAVTTVP